MIKKQQKMISGKLLEVRRTRSFLALRGLIIWADQLEVGEWAPQFREVKNWRDVLCHTNTAQLFAHLHRA